MKIFGRSFALRGAVVALAGAAAVGSFIAPTPAHAWWRGGGFGVVIGVPPVVVAPPAYYAPPPAYYPPASYAPPVAYYGAPHRPVWVPPHWARGYWVPGHWA